MLSKLINKQYTAIQNSNKEPIKAAEKLIDVVIGQPYEVYESFVETFKETNRPDILEIIASGTFPGAFRPTLLCRPDGNEPTLSKGS